MANDMKRTKNGGRGYEAIGKLTTVKVSGKKIENNCCQEILNL